MEHLICANCKNYKTGDKLELSKNGKKRKDSSCMHMTYSYACITNYLTRELTNYIEQSPSSEANMSSASQEMPHIFWNLERHYGIHKSLPPVRIPGHINPVHVLPTHFLKNHFNSILASMSSLPSGLFPSAPTISLLFGHLRNIWWAVKLALETELYFMFIKAVIVKT